MADIVCTVPGCDAEAVLVLNGNPICRPHCEEFVKRAEVLDAPPDGVLTQPVAGLLQSGVEPSDSG